ncbi:MAG: thiol:disulfide interchange protein DsbG [Marinobacter sp.]
MASPVTSTSATDTAHARALRTPGRWQPLLVSALAAATLGASGIAFAQENYPPAVQLLIDRGVSIADNFEAPGGMTGYAGDMQGRPVAFYLTPDGDHIIVGPMLNANGDNLTEPKIQELVQGPLNQKAWAQMGDSAWVLDGSAGAPVIVYTFTDPNCPYCHRFRQAAEPWIDAGKVQLRHVMVGILREDSLSKAATILGADDPQAALRDNQQNYNNGGIEVDRELVSANNKRITANNRLMGELGLSATPSTYYKDENGQIQMQQGLPRPEDMPAVMGSAQP